MQVIMGHAIPMYLGNHLMWVMKRMGIEVLPYSHMQVHYLLRHFNALIKSTNSCTTLNAPL